MENIIEAFTTVLLFLDSIVYFLISWVYQIILLLCQVDILNNSTEMDALVGRIYTIISVIILFLVAYSLLQAIINPDETKGKKSPGNIIKNVLISVALIALTPSIFSFATQFQTSLLMENTIGKLVLGSSEASEAESSQDTIANGGITIASTILKAFLHPNYSNVCTFDESENNYDCSDLVIKTSGLNLLIWSFPGDSISYDDLWNRVIEDGDFLSIPTFAYSIAHDNQMTYYYIVSTAAGVFTFLVLLSYCIDVAVRTIKLAVFELMAPLPILARIMPGEQGNKVFSNWLKACISTYVEVFIRLAILFFAILMIKIVLHNLPTLFLGGASFSGNVTFTVYLFAQVFIVIGIIMFVKQAPQILKDITGLDSGKYNVFGSAMRTLGSFGALGTGLVRGATASQWDSDHKLRSIRRGIQNTLGGGAKSFMNAASKDYKGVGDIRKNTRSSVEDVINKQRQKQAAQATRKRELEQYREEHPYTGTHAKHRPLYHAKTYLGSNFQEAKRDLKEWSGYGGSDTVTDSRMSQAISELTQAIGRMQDAGWKKDPGYVKAKEAERMAAGELESALNAIRNDVNGAKILVDLASSDASVKSRAEADANAIVQKAIGKDYTDVKENASQLKNALKGTERALQKSAGKSAIITSSVNQIQAIMNKYSDLDISDFNKLDGTTYALTGAEKLAVHSYGDLRDKTEYDKFLGDLRAGKDEALNYLEALDKLSNNANRERSNVERRTIERNERKEKKDQK